MRIELPYGQTYLSTTLPHQTGIITPKHVLGLEDEAAAIRDALRNPIGQEPLTERVKPTDRVAIVFSDITRPMPSDRVLPVLLQELSLVVPDEQIVLINGLGTHRVQTHDELVGMLGAEIVERYTIEQHDAWDNDNLVELGITQFGHKALLNRTFYEADFRILTGFIEPHIFAGFSGGPKAVLPAIVGIDTIMDNHGFQMLNEPKATWGITEGNPTWEEIREVALMAKPDLLLNVTLNKDREITRVFCGDMLQAHKQGTDFVRETAMVPVDEPFDIVVTTNSGYPLDINLYQTVKGISCAAQITKPGGAIVIASECRNGVPDYGEFRNIVREGGTPDGVLEAIAQPGYRRHDQWEAQLVANLQNYADVHIYSELDDATTLEMLFTPSHSIEVTIAELLAKYGPHARICAIPEGPQTIPYLAD